MYAEQDKDYEEVKAILRTVTDVIVTIDRKGVVLQVNQALEKQFGYTPSQLQGKNISLLMPDQYASKHDAYLSRYLHTGKAGIIGIGRELVGKHKDGHLFPIHLCVSQVDVLPYFVGVIRDLSELVKLEKEALEKSEMERNRISRELHDDLGQNLVGVAMQLQGIAANMTDKSSPVRHQLFELSTHLQHDISNIKNVISELATVELEEQGLVTALRRFVATCNSYKKARVTFICDDCPLALDYGVAVQMYRIAREAVFNALKHAQANHIKVTLEQQPYAVNLIVEDDGLGLPDDTIMRDDRLSKEGQGLRNIHFRAHVIGASLSIRSIAKEGTTIECLYCRQTNIQTSGGIANVQNIVSG